MDCEVIKIIELRKMGSFVFVAALEPGSVVSEAQRHCTEVVVWGLRPRHYGS